jgi:hypothetical protein
MRCRAVVGHTGFGRDVRPLGAPMRCIEGDATCHGDMKCVSLITVGQKSAALSPFRLLDASKPAQLLRKEAGRRHRRGDTGHDGGGDEWRNAGLL